MPGRSAPTHRALPPSAKAAGIDAATYARELAAFRSWCGGCVRFVSAAVMVHPTTCRECLNAHARRRSALARARGAA